MKIHTLVYNDSVYPFSSKDKLVSHLTKLVDNNEIRVENDGTFDEEREAVDSCDVIVTVDELVEMLYDGSEPLEVYCEGLARNDEYADLSISVDELDKS